MRISQLAKAIAFLVVICITTSGFADALPWQRRRRPGIKSNPRSTALVTPEDWPAEPLSPSSIAPEHFAKALRKLCGWMPPKRPTRWGGYILESAKEFSVDPFLLAALVERMGHCNARADELGGLGLTLIPRSMYAGNYTRGQYHFWLKGPDGWMERTRDISKYPFAGGRLQRAKENIYFAAALLSVWKEQHQTVDEAFLQKPHRHYVSHFIWGDKVISHRAEDRILTDRRRMLQYYDSVASATAQAPPTVDVMGWTFASPLHGGPRVISSWLGAERDGGSRNHRGIDLESSHGEPVLAMADGKVNFSGVDLPGSRSNVNLAPDKLDTIPKNELGNGGRYVCMMHYQQDSKTKSETETPTTAVGTETPRPVPVEEPTSEKVTPTTETVPARPAWLRSCYMHLEDIVVKRGQWVKRGDLIGTVGRTGMKTSSAHLHFEMHSPDELLDGSKMLAGLLLGHQPQNETPEELRKKRRRELIRKKRAQKEAAASRQTQNSTP